MLVMVTGGAKSGKSTFAEQLGRKMGNEGIFIATDLPSSHLDYCEKPQLWRPFRPSEESSFNWKTVEQPLAITEVIEQINNGSNIYRADKRVVVVDHLSGWLANWLGSDDVLHSRRHVREKADTLLAALSSYQGTMIIITSEVMGLPFAESPLDRLYLDVLGELNRSLAARSKAVFLMTAGIPIELKQLQYTQLDGEE